MDGEDQQAMGSGTRSPGKAVSQHVKSQRNDKVLHMQGDGKEREAITESGDFKFGVADGVACLLNHVQTSETSEESSLSFSSSHFTRNGSSKLIAGECSGLRDDTPTGGVQNKDAIFQLSHKERLSQLEIMENCGGNSEAFSGEDVSSLIN